MPKRLEGLVLTGDHFGLFLRVLVVVAQEVQDTVNGEKGNLSLYRMTVLPRLPDRLRI